MIRATVRKGAFMSWTRRQRRPFETIGILAAASALVVTSLVTAAPVVAADAPPALSSTFDGGTYAPWVVNGDASLALVADPDGTGESLKVSGRTHAYDGVALDLTTVLQRDVSYAISFKARLADAAQQAHGDCRQQGVVR